MIDVTVVAAVGSFIVDQLLKTVRLAALLGIPSNIVGINAALLRRHTTRYRSQRVKRGA